MARDFSAALSARELAALIKGWLTVAFDMVVAVSVGIVGQRPLLDLDYSEDSTAEVDMNVVMTSEGRFTEVQGTAEGMAFTRAELDELLVLAELGIAQILDLQQKVLAVPPAPRA